MFLVQQSLHLSMWMFFRCEAMSPKKKRTRHVSQSKSQTMKSVVYRLVYHALSSFLFHQDGHVAGFPKTILSPEP